MSVIEALSLDDVEEVPDETSFKSDNDEVAAFIGKTWFDASYNVKPDVYLFKVCGGNYGVVGIKDYEMDFGKMQIKNIIWEYKYNDNGSTDFSSTPVSSFETGNAYDNACYFSFTDGKVTSTDPSHITVEGSSFWLGHGTTVKKLANTDIADIGAVDDSGMQTDTSPSYISLGWYNYGEGHLLTPKDYVYVVKTSDSKYAAFEITNYYDSEGNSGTFTIDWKYLN